MNYFIGKIMLLAALFFISQHGMGQANKSKSLSINFGPEISFPETALGKTHNTGYGGSFKAEYTFGKHASATINSGISLFKGNRYFDDVLLSQKEYKSLTAIPIKVGLRYYVSNFYASGETGMVFLNKYLNTSRPVVSLGVGDKIKIGQSKIDISLRQEFWLGNPQNLNMAVLRVAYEIVW
jgi:hypothetical protein